MALKSVASEYGFGGVVDFSSKEGEWGPDSFNSKLGSMLLFFSVALKITLQPLSIICFPCALNFSSLTDPFTVVWATLQSS